MKKVSILLLLIILGSKTVKAQEFKTAPLVRNGVFLEILGNGFLYSLNYEHFFKDHFAWRVGAMYFGGSGENDANETLNFNLLIMPVMLNYVLGSGSHHIEIGAGPTLVYLSVEVDVLPGISGFAFGGTARLGYLYRPPQGGLTFRLAYTPILSDIFTHSVGLGVGLAF